MKKNLKTLVVAAFCVAVTGVIVSSAAGVNSRIRLCGPQYCLDVWNPVTCSNGVTYSNACYAARACATGCVPGNPAS